MFKKSSADSKWIGRCSESKKISLENFYLLYFKCNSNFKNINIHSSNFFNFIY